MRKILKCLLFMLLLSALCLTGCSKYLSHYKAVGFVHSNLPKSALMTFYSFEGDMVFRLKPQKAPGGQIRVSAKLEEGSAMVYYDDGDRKEMFSIRAGGELESVYGPFDSGTVSVIVQTLEPCRNGSFTFTCE